MKRWMIGNDGGDHDNKHIRQARETITKQRTNTKEGSSNTSQVDSGF